MIFPWQEREWQQLQNAKATGRLPHALLITGIAGIGKSVFAHAFANALLCHELTHTYACGACHDCRLIAGRTHPNLLWIEPEKEGQAIKVDQIRDINEFVQQSSLQGVYRIVIINPANKMNVNAANALLKTLEEPASDAIILLISDQSKPLPATILSRCQRIQLHVPSVDVASQWLKKELKNAKYDYQLLLKLANGAPVAALKLIEDDMLAIRSELLDALCLLTQKNANPVMLAANFSDVSLLPFLDMVLNFLVDTMHLQLNNHDILNQDYAIKLSEIAQKTSLTLSDELLQFLQTLRIQLSVGINLNKQLTVEDILIRWYRLFVPNINVRSSYVFG